MMYTMPKNLLSICVNFTLATQHYDAAVRLDKVPQGVRIGFKSDAFSPVIWDELPEDEDWFCHG